MIELYYMLSGALFACPMPDSLPLSYLSVMEPEAWPDMLHDSPGFSTLADEWNSSSFNSGKFRVLDGHPNMLCEWSKISLLRWVHISLSKMLAYLWDNFNFLVVVELISCKFCSAYWITFVFCNQINPALKKRYIRKIGS